MDRYVAVFYFVITTMSTTGYGDITPVTLAERIDGVLIMCAGVILFALILDFINDGIKYWRDRFEEFKIKYHYLDSLKKDVSITRTKEDLNYMNMM